MAGKLEVSHHPLAPLYNRGESQLLFQHIQAEVTSQNFHLGEEIQELLRQTCYVNLWFFLKYVCGYAGPYDLLNDDLHVDMANYRQSLLQPGARGAMFIPRGHFKSTIVTEGGAAWELVRNPNLRICISNAIADKAQDFLKSVKAIYDSNEFFWWLFPEKMVNEKSRSEWNNTVLVVPDRTKKYREGSVEYGGIGGAREGHHYDLHIVDDMIGLASLNANRGANAVMEDTRHWFESSEDTLLISPTRSRVIVVGTRYAVDDVYDDIIAESKTNLGYPLKNYEPNPYGKWDVYYRKGIEDDEVIFPENFSLEWYMDLQKNKWWTWATQYMNEPESSGLAEFSDFKLKPCNLDWDENARRWIIVYNENNEEHRIALSECDVVQAGDPAATERYVSAKTSRSAVGVLATDSELRRFLIFLQVGYVPASTFFDWFFQGVKKFGTLIRSSVLEAQGPFKIMGPLLKQEEVQRKVSIRLQPFPASGDKDARIRTAWESELKEKRFYVVKCYIDQVWGEMRAFPQGTKKDILDMVALALSKSIRPMTTTELADRQKDDDAWNNRRHNEAGW